MKDMVEGTKRARERETDKDRTDTESDEEINREIVKPVDHVLCRPAFVGRPFARAVSEN